jgi:hypothetical protein
LSGVRHPRHGYLHASNMRDLPPDFAIEEESVAPNFCVGAGDPSGSLPLFWVELQGPIAESKP